MTKVYVESFWASNCNLVCCFIMMLTRLKSSLQGNIKDMSAFLGVVVEIAQFLEFPCRHSSHAYFFSFHVHPNKGDHSTEITK